MKDMEARLEHAMRQNQQIHMMLKDACTATATSGLPVCRKFVSINLGSVCPAVQHHREDSFSMVPHGRPQPPGCEPAILK